MKLPDKIKSKIEIKSPEYLYNFKPLCVSYGISFQINPKKEISLLHLKIAYHRKRSEENDRACKVSGDVMMNVMH